MQGSGGAGRAVRGRGRAVNEVHTRRVTSTGHGTFTASYHTMRLPGCQCHGLYFHGHIIVSLHMKRCA
jgi:hypothetical protein